MKSFCDGMTAAGTKPLASALMYTGAGTSDLASSFPYLLRLSKLTRELRAASFREIGRFGSTCVGGLSSDSCFSILVAISFCSS